MQNANDTLYTEPKSPFSVMQSIDTQDPLAIDLSAPRSNQQTMLAGSVTPHILGNIITSTAPTTATLPTTSKPITIASGGSQSFLFTVADIQGKSIIAVPQPNVYINTVSTANHWPTTTYNMTNLPVCMFNDSTLSNGSNIVTRVEVGNTSLGSVIVVVTCSWRVITQPNVTLVATNATPTVAAIGP
jgi:hypothetical protein